VALEGFFGTSEATEYKEELELNGIRQLLLYGDVKLLGKKKIL
jgi:hypothetical protein